LFLESIISLGPAIAVPVGIVLSTNRSPSSMVWSAGPSGVPDAAV
jgi:hypothetical protein